MDKAQRLEYMRKRFPQLELDHEREKVDAVLPVTKRDVADETSLMDSYREFQRDQASGSEVLTSDER